MVRQLPSRMLLLLQVWRLGGGTAGLRLRQHRLRLLLRLLLLLLSRAVCGRL